MENQLEETLRTFLADENAENVKRILDNANLVLSFKANFAIFQFYPSFFNSPDFSQLMPPKISPFGVICNLCPSSFKN